MWTGTNLSIVKQALLHARVDNESKKLCDKSFTMIIEFAFFFNASLTFFVKVHVKPIVQVVNYKLLDLMLFMNLY